MRFIYFLWNGSSFFCAADCFFPFVAAFLLRRGFFFSSAVDLSGSHVMRVFPGCVVEYAFLKSC